MYLSTRPKSRGAYTEQELIQLLKELPHQLRQRNDKRIKAWNKPKGELRRLLKHDYVASLRRGLSYAQVRALSGAFREIFPRFNTRSLAMMRDAEFRALTERLQVHLNASPYEENDGLALRGFYMTEAPGVLKQPLIFVNTAHHRLAAMTTFVHEVGHHVASRLLNLEPAPVHFFIDAAYADHLSEPGELAADIAVCLAGYPAATARRIFATPWNWGLVARAENLTEAAFTEVRRHLKKAYDFDLPMEQMSEERRLHYLTGMIHYAKLRWALLAEYDL